MGEDLSNVPRRLRRFYRHGQPIPPEMVERAREPEREQESPVKWKQTKQAPAPKPVSKPISAPRATPSASPPWSNAKRGVFERVQASQPKHVHDRARIPTTPSPEHDEMAAAMVAQPEEDAAPKKGIFEKISGMLGNKHPPVHHALGLKHLPGQPIPPSAAPQAQPPRQTASTEEIEKTLAELRRNMNNPSAPQAVPSKSDTTPSDFQEKKPLPRFNFTSTLPSEARDDSASKSEGENSLSPRERMMQRRAERQSEEPPAEKKGAAPAAPAEDATSSYMRHYRRNRGQLPGENASEPAPASPASSPVSKATDSLEGMDMKDLFGDESKSKKKKKKEDDLGMPLDDELEDLPLLEDNE